MLAAIRAKCGAPVGVITSTTGDGGGDSCGTYGERCAWHYCNFTADGIAISSGDAMRGVASPRGFSRGGWWDGPPRGGWCGAERQRVRS
jgi:hypothetical protein